MKTPSHRIKKVSDESLIHREFYNAHNHTVFFVRDKTRDAYVSACGIPLGPDVIKVRTQDWCHLPHTYFVPTCEKQCPAIEGVFNFGNTIGKGNKLPSLPIVDAKWQKPD